MTNRTEDHEIEDRLRRTFQAVASTTKVSDDLIDGPADVIRLDQERVRRRPYWMLGVAAAVVAAAGVTAVLVSRDTTERTVPPASDGSETTPVPVTTAIPPPGPAASSAAPGRHAVLGSVAPLVWLETEENEPLADMTISLERWVDGDREVTVVDGANNLANLPCDDVCSVGGPTAVYQSGLTQAEVDAIAADPSTLAAGPFQLVQQSSVWPETASTVSIWGEHENVDETGRGASVTITSFPGVALDFDALEHLPVEKIEINDRPALYVTGLFPRDVQDHPAELDGRDAIIWSPTEDVTVALMVDGFDREQLLAYANDVVLVGDAAWADLVATPTGRDPHAELRDGGGLTVAVGAAGDWELVSYQGGGLDTGVSVCYELFNQAMLWQQCGPLRVAVAPLADQAVVTGDADTVPTASSVRMVTNDGLTIDADLVDGPFAGRLFTELVPQSLGPVTLEWLDADGHVVDSEIVALDQPLVGG